MPDMRIERFGRFGIGRFGRQDITTPSIKSLNHPLPSTFLHSYPLIKISVRIKTSKIDGVYLYYGLN